MVMETMSSGFDALLARMERNGVCRPEERVGCTAEEIAALEAAYGVRLPASYRRYLSEMGHDAGRLFRHDHTEAHYGEVLTLTARERELWPDYAPPWTLAANTLLISQREGDYFSFIHCDDEVDSPVWVYDVYRWTITRSAPGVVAWLEAWCSEAELAISHGYFGRIATG